MIPPFSHLFVIFLKSIAFTASTCGSLTISITLGFVLGLVSGNKLNDISSFREKKNFINRSYSRATLAAVALALSANEFIASSLGGFACTGIAVLSSGVMSSALSFQFFQFPSLVSKTFGGDKAITQSVIEGFALITSSRILSSIVNIASTTGLSSNGWTLAWLFLAACFALGERVTNAFLPYLYDSQ